MLGSGLMELLVIGVLFLVVAAPLAVLGWHLSRDERNKK